MLQAARRAPGRSRCAASRDEKLATGYEDVGRTRGGPKAPVATTPPRAPCSVRRTTTIDSTRAAGPGGSVAVSARGRDLLTTARGATRVLGSEGFAATLSADRVLRAIEHHDARLAALVGASVSSGFRARALALLPEEAARGTLLNQLLDDLPGASLVAGYALQRDASWGERVFPAEQMAFMSDLCAGWAADATILQAVRATGSIPVPTTAIFTAGAADDAEAWHEYDALPAGGMRRARRIDLAADDPDGATLGFDVHFRDSHRDGEEGEGAVHEYGVRGRFTRDTRIVLALDAVAHVLPWTECPGALGSARRIVGTTLDDLRARVRTDFVGATTCTHLNDVLRSLADLPALAVVLDDGTGRS